MRRQRADGSWTTTTEDWDARWYWPAGTRARLRPLGFVGTITKQHTVTVNLRLDDGRELARVPMPQLERVS